MRPLAYTVALTRVTMNQVDASIGSKLKAELARFQANVLEEEQMILQRRAGKKRESLRTV